MFGIQKETIHRTAIITLDEGSKVRIKLSIPPQKLRFINDFERDFVQGWNQSQPHAQHKVVKCHVLRK